MSIAKRTFEAIERHPGAIVAGLGAMALGAYLVALTAFPRPHGRILDGDAIQYYAYLRSAVFDGDLDFRNDYAVLYRPETAGNVWLTARTPTGRAPNMMAIGSAIFWSPVLLATLLMVAAARLVGAEVPLDGFAAPFQLAVGAAGVGYATAGAYLCHRVAARLYAPGPALWGALAAWLATPAIYYSFISPAYGHAVSLFTVALFTWTWLATRHQGWSRRRAALLGLLGGLAALVRWQDAVVFALPLVELVRRKTNGTLSWRRLVLALLVMAAVAALAFAPQLLAWQNIYGRWVLVPQGAAFMRWSEPALWQVLFSTRRGLFLWTPAVLPAAIGVLLVGRRDRDLGWGVVAVFALSIYLNACVSDWWAGEAFGARRFVGDTVFFALGFAALFAALWPLAGAGVARGVALALIVYNGLFLVQYQLFMRGFHELAPYPTTLRQILVDRLTLPWRLLRVWLQ